MLRTNGKRVRKAYTPNDIENVWHPLSVRPERRCEAPKSKDRKQTQKLCALRISLFLAFLCLHDIAQAAPLLRIVGSSSVFPFAATVAEHFSHKTHESVPLVESIGTGAGIKLFCGHQNGPDGAIASRPMTSQEKTTCQANGIKFEEFVIGQDGLVLIQQHKAQRFSPTLDDLNQALSEKVQKDGQCVMNPNKTWNSIRPAFPSLPIRVLGPAPTSGTYDILVEKLANTCGPLMRHDGGYIEAAANENLIIQKVLNTPNTVGIITFGFYDQNRERLQALPVDGVAPSSVSIQDKSYTLSRPLYLYIKTNPSDASSARRAYTLEFLSEDAVKYLKEKGLIPLSEQEQKAMREKVQGELE
jgi:phosphate transport system substrate-binding protein